MIYIKLYFFLLFFVLSVSLYGMSFDTVNVVYYYNKIDFIAQKNGVNAQFRIKKIVAKEFKGTLLYDYIIKWANEDSSQKIINKSIYAIVTPKDTLISLREFDKSMSFQKLITIDSFWFIYSNLNPHSMTYGGGLIGAAVASSIPPDMIMALPNSNTSFLLDKSIIKRCLRKTQNKDGLEKFKNEEIYSLEIRYKYVKEYKLLDCFIEDLIPSNYGTD